MESSSHSTRTLEKESKHRSSKNSVSGQKSEQKTGKASSHKSVKKNSILLSVFARSKYRSMSESCKCVEQNAQPISGRKCTKSITDDKNSNRSSSDSRPCESSSSLSFSINDIPPRPPTPRFLESGTPGGEDWYEDLLFEDNTKEQWVNVINKQFDEVYEKIDILCAEVTKHSENTSEQKNEEEPTTVHTICASKQEPGPRINTDSRHPKIINTENIKQVSERAINNENSKPKIINIEIIEQVPASTINIDSSYPKTINTEIVKEVHTPTISFETRKRKIIDTEISKEVSRTARTSSPTTTTAIDFGAKRRRVAQKSREEILASRPVLKKFEVTKETEKPKQKHLIKKYYKRLHGI